MKAIVWLTLKVAILRNVIICEAVLTPSSSKCNFEGGFCDIDANACLKSSRENDNMSPCRHLNYDELYYGTTTSTTFSVNQASRDIVNSTYGLISIEKDSDTWLPVKDCCNLPLGQSCQLRPIYQDEDFEVFVTSKSRVCYEHIYVSNSDKQWCRSMDEIHCLTLHNGTAVVKTRFSPASARSYSASIRSDYCFFSVPEKIVLGNSSNGNLIWNVPGMNLLGEKSGKLKKNVKLTEQVKTELGNVTCQVKNNVDNCTEYLLDYEIPPRHASCFFIRTKRTSWKEMPVCIKPLPDSSKSIWKITVGVLSIFIIILLVLIVLREKVKSCLPSYTNSMKEISHHVVNINESQEFLNYRETCGDLSNELPDEITFLDFRSQAESKLPDSRGVGGDEKVTGKINYSPSLESKCCTHRNPTDSGCILEVLSDDIFLKMTEKGDQRTHLRISGFEVGAAATDGMESLTGSGAVSQNSVTKLRQSGILSDCGVLDNTNTAPSFATENAYDDCAKGNNVNKSSICRKQNISDYVKKNNLSVG